VPTSALSATRCGGYDEQDGAHWIGGVLIAADEQGTGSGRAAMLTLIEDATSSR
jgi:hypothetical protein